ncbi:MAG: hypothetical protein ACU841_00120 [Gammaproteobacteria bacterium]
MVFYAINLGVITILFFIIGMIKPKWALFFLKEPSRFTILMITPILIMITITMYGEGLKREREEKALKMAPVKAVPAPATAPVPVPTPETPPVK